MTASPFTVLWLLLLFTMSAEVVANPDSPPLHEEQDNLLAQLPQEAFYHSEIIPYADDIKYLYQHGESDNFLLKKRSPTDWLVKYRKAAEPTFRLRVYAAERKTYICIKTISDGSSFMSCWSDRKEVDILPNIKTSFFLDDPGKFSTRELMKYTMVDQTFHMDGSINVRGIYVLYSAKIKGSDFAYDAKLTWNPKGDGAFELSRQRRVEQKDI